MVGLGMLVSLPRLRPGGNRTAPRADGQQPPFVCAATTACEWSDRR